MTAEVKPAQDLLEGSRQTLGAFGALLVLFCAFFWLGFFVGKSSTTTPAATAAPVAPTKNTEPTAPASQRTDWRIATLQHM